MVSGRSPDILLLIVAVLFFVAAADSHVSTDAASNDILDSAGVSRALAEESLKTIGKVPEFVGPDRTSNP